MKNFRQIADTALNELEFITPDYVMNHNGKEMLRDMIAVLEGGFNYDIVKIDRGGPTFMGIASNTSAKHATFVEEVAKMSKEEAADAVVNFYIDNYISNDKYLLHIFEINYFLGAFLFFYKIWGTPYRSAVSLIQAQLDDKYGLNLDIDGYLGPKTLSAIESADSAYLIDWIGEYAQSFVEHVTNKVISIDPHYKSIHDGLMRRAFLPIAFLLAIKYTIGDLYGN